MYAVVACSACRQPWVTETRHATVSCPACSTPVGVTDRRRLWQGMDAREAREQAARIRMELAGGRMPEPATPVPRHDSPTDAAAAQGAGIVNKSQRAETVALWMTRLVGDHPHDDLILALEKAGLASDRAAAEVHRMLACDILMEPRAGRYRSMQA